MGVGSNCGQRRGITDAGPPYGAQGEARAAPPRGRATITMAGARLGLGGRCVRECVEGGGEGVEGDCRVAGVVRARPGARAHRGFGKRAEGALQSRPSGRAPSVQGRARAAAAARRGSSNSFRAAARAAPMPAPWAGPKPAVLMQYAVCAERAGTG
ncbi:MAG: hypothetical protein J3K34DRAFT_399473 [Monoraphidium minutum]|nr:MAG: hypothetical protein J3K34DRAFT_399473 [Monoraphidium minutum]